MTLSLDPEKDWTYEDYSQIPEDGQVYQVIDGRLFVTPSPVSIHQVISRRLLVFFYQFEMEGRGFIFHAPMDLILRGGTPVQPDLLYLTHDQRGMVKEKFIEGSPHLVVEILSPSTRSLDRVTKMNLYAANKIPLYVLVEPQDQTVEIFRFENGHYFLDQALDQDGSWEFQGKRLELKTLFAPLGS